MTLKGDDQTVITMSVSSIVNAANKRKVALDSDGGSDDEDGPDEEGYVVEQIFAKRSGKNGVEYQIQWAPSWQPAEYVKKTCPLMKRRFDKSGPTQKKTRKKETKKQKNNTQSKKAKKIPTEDELKEQMMALWHPKGMYFGADGSQFEESFFKQMEQECAENIVAEKIEFAPHVQCSTHKNANDCARALMGRYALIVQLHADLVQHQRRSKIKMPRSQVYARFGKHYNSIKNFWHDMHQIIHFDSYCQRATNAQGKKERAYTL